MMRAVVLLSGGLDSATTLALARAEGRACHCLSFAYGQRHAVELERARAVARHLQAREHRVITLDPDSFAGSALTDPDIPVPTTGPAPGIPPTYVPARNTVFLAHALAWAEVLAAGEIFIGVNAVDYSGYPDCRPEFIEAFARVAALATRAAVAGRPTRIRAPLQHLSKGQIIRHGLELGVDYSLTLSCYSPAPGGLACGVCDSCRLRLRGFAAAGVEDPALYVDTQPPTH